MQYRSHYNSRIGGITLASDGEALTGLWFDGQKYFADTLGKEHEDKDLPIFTETKKWLDIYFNGEVPDSTPSIHVIGSDFRKAVWEVLMKIPYGQTTTYGQIAKQIANKKGISRMSSQAIGGAVGHNSISLIIPCHRVVGTNGSLTGYAGGIDKKIWLLEHEGVNMDGLFRPKYSTAE